MSSKSISPLPWSVRRRSGRTFFGALFTHSPLVVAFTVFLSAAGLASAVSLDGSFTPVLRDFGSSGNGFPTSYISLVQPDGKILVGGKFTVANGVARSGIVRFNADYTLDISFNAGDFTVASSGISIGTGGSIEAIKLQPDGKIVIGGSFIQGNENLNRAIARLNADGSTDTTFLPVTSAVLDGGVGDLEIQPDGKIVFGGTFQVTTTNPATGQTVTFNNLARVNPDGSFDFGFTGNAYEYSSNIVLLPGGKIAVGNSQYSNPGGIAVVRYNANGTFDTIMATIDGFGIEALELQPDGKLLVAGSINFVDDVFKKRIARLNANGGLDPSFDVVDTLNGTIYDLTLDASGRILISGDFYIYDGTVTQYNVARLTPTGARDVSFNIDRRISGNVLEVNILPTGQILLGGAFPVITDTVNFNTFYENIALVNANGTIDESRHIAFSVTEQGGVFDLLQQPDGKVLVGGEFQFAEGVSRRSLARYNTDGSLDQSFDTQRNLGIVSNFALQPDGKILVANGGATVNLQRVNADGTLDSSFTSPFVSFSASIQARTIVRTVVVQPDGKILVGGKLITGSATSPTLSGLVRLNPDGSRDTTFQIVFARGGTNFVNDLALQPDGKVVLGGDFTNVSNDSSFAYLARVNSDGTLDAAFHPTPPGLINEIELQPNGKIVYGGNFGALLRVNADGTLDSFNVPLNDAVQALTVQPDNQILVGGLFTSINNVPRNRIARLANDGTLDPSFTVSANSTVYDINLQANGAILLGGQFTRIDGESRIAAARLSGGLRPSAVVSRKTHGSAGAFDLPLSLSGAPAIECRSGGADRAYEIVFTFPTPVTFRAASVAPGSTDKSAVINKMEGSGTNAITVTLVSVSNAQVLNLNLQGVTNGVETSNVTVPLGILVGDTTGDGFVNSGDTIQTRNRAGQDVGSANFRSDVNADGVINVGDTFLVRAGAGLSTESRPEPTAEMKR